MNRIMTILFLLQSVAISAQQPGRLSHRKATMHDTLAMLYGKTDKFWDRIDTAEMYRTTNNIHWAFFKDHTVLEYRYANKKRVEQIYGGDVLYGRMPFSINGDTLTMGVHSIHKIIKLTADTLVTQEIGKNIQAVYKRSANQLSPIQTFEKKAPVINKKNKKRKNQPF